VYDPWSLSTDDDLPPNVARLPAGTPYTPELAFRVVNPRDKGPTVKVQFQCPASLQNEVLAHAEKYRDTFDRSGQVWATAMVNYLLYIRDHYDSAMDQERQYAIGLFKQLSRVQMLAENSERHKLLAAETCDAIRRAQTSVTLAESVLATLDDTLRFLAPEPDLQAMVEREASSLRPRLRTVK
jgi:hypothetical protein